MMGSERDAYQKITEFLEFFWNKKGWFFIPFVTAVFFAGALIFFLPKTYQSSTFILVEEPRSSQSSASALSLQPVESALEPFRQQILSRSFLQKIIDRFGLYKGVNGTKEEIIEEMRENIQMTAAASERMNAFSISYSGRDPVVVMKVTATLANLFISEDLRFRQQQSDGATGFIGGELESVKKILEEQEDKISRFEREHHGKLPEQLDANLRTLDRLQIDLQLTQEAKRSIQAMVSVDPQLQKMAALKRQLVGLQQRFRDNYPGIHELKAQIREMEEMRAISSKRPISPLASSDPEWVGRPGGEPAAGREMVKLFARETRLRERILVLEDQIEQTSRLGQERDAILLNYNNIRKNYHALLNKNLDVQISESMGQPQKGGRFRIVDPANFPKRPYRPNPTRIGLAGVLMGLLAGTLLLWFQKNLDKTVYRPEDLENLIFTPVFGYILYYNEARICEPAPSPNKIHG
jgi:polysaccharide chain length determinant protein (PEP-CTERM system associated)